MVSSLSFNRQMAEKGEFVKKTTLTIPVLGIRLVSGKTFGFARLADRGGDAFVTPPLMRQVGEKIPPHAIVEVAEKGRRIVRFLDQPETRLVWEGQVDEKRMVALVPEITKRWFSLKEQGHGIIAVSDYGHEEFSSLWFAACSAGEAGKILAKLDREFMRPAKHREVEEQLPRLFEKWKAGLEARVTLDREQLVKIAREGHYRGPETRHLPWWYEYATMGMQIRVSAIVAPLCAETNRLCEVAKAERKADEEGRQRGEKLCREAEYSQSRHGVWQGLVLAGLDGLISPDEPLKDWPSAGAHFPLPHYSRTDKLCAWVWYAERRQVEATGLLTEAAQSAGIEYQKTWYEAPSWDPNYYSRNDDSDNIYCGSSCGEYVGGGIRSAPLLWFTEALQRISAADEAANLRADLPSLVVAELKRQMEILDSETLSETNLPWAEESKLHLPESKEKIRAIRSEEARIKKDARVEELRQRGLREEDARLAAQNAEEEKRLLDLAKVRQDWARMLNWLPGSGGYRGLHPEAQALLEEMRKKESELREAAWKLEQKRAEEQARKKQAEKESFLGKGAWDALNGLKL